MAQTQRTRRIVGNPGGRHARRRLSAAQIAAGFGGKRRQSAAKSARKTKRKSHAAKHRSNAAPKRAPKKSAARKQARKTSKPRRRARPNTGGLIEVALGPLSNPGTPKRRSMAKSKKRSSATHKHHAKRRRPSPNPGRRRSAGRRRHARRGNPGAMSGVGGFMSAAAWAIAGAVGSKYLTQAVLGQSNTGYLGYGSNLIAAFVMGKGVGMFVKNKQAENAVILGGVIQTLLRWAIDQTPIGAKLATIGMGDYQATTIFSPVRYLDPMKSAAVDLPSSIQPRMTAAQVAAATAPAGMSGFSRDTYSAKNSTY